ncbi:hypothetical protein AMTR_s00349p00012820 [Amborella trichopoda]|uniref:FAR1 domain-containing protein n=1 Tax=Amborella trichopoda TaxID=13333 RepID=W1NQK1_AMBTC|nr:hypothetical protein AMTR_s00349p00012820 [Amborella trichopoda]
MDQDEFYKNKFMDVSYDNVIATGDGEDIEVPLFCDQQNNSEHQKDLFIGMDFEYEDVVNKFYNAYAERKGFSIRLVRPRKDKDNNLRKRDYVCLKDGKNSSSTNNKGRMQSNVKGTQNERGKVGCNEIC